MSVSRLSTLLAACSFNDGMKPAPGLSAICADEHAVTLAPLSRALADGAGPSDREWMSWAHFVIARGLIDPPTLIAMWREIVAYDDVLAGYLASLVQVPERTIIVSGSGKETFKTFNVSTAAAILAAAAAGARVVTGVSASVSATSGSADILASLGVGVLTDPAAITGAVSKNGLAFIPYAAFCPRYAARYDGRFRALNPMSFLMPAATLAVSAFGFIHGLAHLNVETSAAGIVAARPELITGQVVTTLVSASERVDEIAGLGSVRIATVTRGAVSVSETAFPRAGTAWRNAVGHRSSHLANARAVVNALSPDGNPDACDLVERNSAAILALSAPGMPLAEARCEIRRARESGAAIRLLRKLDPAKAA